MITDPNNDDDFEGDEWKGTKKPKQKKTKK